MSIIRKDKNGNFNKVAGNIVQRWNDRLFKTTHTIEAGKDVYTIEPIAKKYITGLTDHTEFQLYFDTPNTTNDVSIRFGERTLKLERADGDPLGINYLYRRVSLFTLEASVDNTIWLTTLLAPVVDTYKGGFTYALTDSLLEDIVNPQLYDTAIDLTTKKVYEYDGAEWELIDTIIILQNGFYWMIDFFPDFYLNSGKIVWDGASNFWDIYVDKRKYVLEAPHDGKMYGRINDDWAEIVDTSYTEKFEFSIEPTDFVSDEATIEVTGLDAGKIFLVVPSNEFDTEAEIRDNAIEFTNAELVFQVTDDEELTITAGVTPTETIKIAVIIFGSDLNVTDFIRKENIVNNLVTGGSSKVLSAEQGKVLKNLHDGVVDSLNTKLDKATEPTTYPQVYGKLITGVQARFNLSSDVVNYAIVTRDVNGQIKVPGSPTDISHATSKQYVDGNFIKILPMNIDLSTFSTVVLDLNALIPDDRVVHKLEFKKAIISGGSISTNLIYFGYSDATKYNYKMSAFTPLYLAKDVANSSIVMHYFDAENNTWAMYSVSTAYPDIYFAPYATGVYREVNL